MIDVNSTQNKIRPGTKTENGPLTKFMYKCRQIEGTECVNFSVFWAPAIM